MKLKILQIHNFYAVRGGEDVVVENEAAALSGEGHQVFKLYVRNEAQLGMVGRVRYALGSLFSLVSYLKTRNAIKRWRPDVVHIHNTFPRLSSSVAIACLHARTPVVMTIHNYRLLCPTSLLFYDGRVTFKSIESGPWWGLRSKVYKNSFLGTLFLILGIQLNTALRVWQRSVGTFVVPSQCVLNVFAGSGFDPSIFTVKEHFVDDDFAVADVSSESRPFRALYVGRIAPGKGVDVLLEAHSKLSHLFPLDIAGPGVSSSQDNVRFLGPVSREEVRRQMLRASVLVVPSEWYEPFGMVVAEAFSVGLPVIGANIGALPELIHHGKNGLLFEPGSASSLCAQLRWAFENVDLLEEMRREAHQLYRARFSSASSTRKLTQIYNRARFRPIGREKSLWAE